MVSKKSKIVFSVKVCRLEFFSLPFADQLQPNFFKTALSGIEDPLPCIVLLNVPEFLSSYFSV